MNRDQIETFMKAFPPEKEILEMDPEDLGVHVLRYMTRQNAETHRFNGQILMAG